MEYMQLHAQMYTCIFINSYFINIYFYLQTNTFIRSLKYANFSLSFVYMNKLTRCLSLSLSHTHSQKICVHAYIYIYTYIY